MSRFSAACLAALTATAIVSGWQLAELSWVPYQADVTNRLTVPGLMIRQDLHGDYRCIGTDLAHPLWIALDDRHSDCDV
jgi:hypothetical protein